MTPEQSTQVVQYLAAAWRVEVGALTMAAWMNTLNRVSVDVGRESARLAVEHGGEFMPSPGDFLKLCQSTARRLAGQQEAIAPESQGRRPSRAEALERVAELRQVVAAAEVRLPSRRSPTPPSDRPERRVPLTPCALDDHRFCGSASAARPKEPSADDASPPESQP